ncbi:MAG: hypothetical protein WDW36_004695 [Sanguina aurantia]
MAGDSGAPAEFTASPEDNNPTNSNIEAKFELLKKVACLNRGALATANDRYEVESMVEVLEESISALSSSAPASRALASLQGKWELLYSSVEVFRSSPFFSMFSEGLVQNRDIASSIFAFTDAIPGATIGSAFQTFNFDGAYTGTLASEVTLTVWPGLTGTVVTNCIVAQSPPRRLEVTVESTSVAGSNVFGPLLDNVSVPVQRLVEGVRGQGSTRVELDITYLDDDLRVARQQPDNAIFVYRRVY